MSAILCSIIENLKRGFEDDWMRLIETGFIELSLIGLGLNLNRG